LKRRQKIWQMKTIMRIDMKDKVSISKVLH
jgi:hypothetical protein